jgi:hypothetical protein
MFNSLLIDKKNRFVPPKRSWKQFCQQQFFNIWKRIQGFFIRRNLTLRWQRIDILFLFYISIYHILLYFIKISTHLWQISKRELFYCQHARMIVCKDFFYVNCVFIYIRKRMIVKNWLNYLLFTQIKEIAVASILFSKIESHTKQRNIFLNENKDTRGILNFIAIIAWAHKHSVNFTRLSGLSHFRRSLKSLQTLTKWKSNWFYWHSWLQL